VRGVAIAMAMAGEGPRWPMVEQDRV